MLIDENGTLATPADFARTRPAETPAAKPENASRSSRGILRDRSSRFVGDLNPEAIFIEATRSGPARAGASRSAAAVGVWLSSAPAQLSKSSQDMLSSSSRTQPILDQLYLRFVEEHCLPCLPPPDDFRELKALYLRKIHPIFPVVPQGALEPEAMTPADILMKQVVCLAAAADQQMASHLRLLPYDGDPLPFQDFSQTLSGAARAILDTNLVADRVIHIRALVLLSLYVQPSRPDEADLPALLGGRAVHHAQTLGLQVVKSDTGQGGDELEALFCAVWAVDRLNAAVYGRPCLLHERDMSGSMDGCVRKRDPCFRLFLSVVQWLDRVIELYRPGPSTEASGYRQIAFIDLPVLEAMIDDAGAYKIPSPLLGKQYLPTFRHCIGTYLLAATIEAFYHAVIILSCRLPRPDSDVPSSGSLPPPSANARRSLAADRIVSSVPRDNLSPVPFVPYAVSLALSVEYRKMRHSRLPMFRARARAAFRSNCELLHRFGDIFWGARVIAGLGERVLREMERSVNSVAQERPAPPPSAPDEPNGTANPPGAFANGQPSNASSNGNGESYATGNEVADLDSVELNFIDLMPDFDVFGHFDPNFNLNAVDNVLEAHLDIGQPLNWIDWEQAANQDTESR